MIRSFIVYLTISIFFITLHGCSLPVIIPVASSHAPKLYDDGDLSLLRKSLIQTLNKLRFKPPTALVSLGRRRCSVKRLVVSLRFLLDLIADNPDPVTLDARIKRSFDLYQSTGFNFFIRDRAILVTGYYQPVFNGSLKGQGDYKHPLYSMPLGLEVGYRKNSIVSGTPEVDWSRRAIVTRGLCAGNELVWLKDPMDSYILHVQGSGLIRLKDGSLRGVGYAGANGLPYKSIGFHMAATGRLSLQDVSLPSIRRYISSHPDERDEILFHNDSFIFFRWNKNTSAQGALGVELIPGRSIAVDFSYVPAGGLVFLKTSRPVIEKGQVKGWRSINRIVVAQDTGSAIKGPGRVDLFCGTGEQAGELSGHLKREGLFFILLLKDKLFARYK
ncbi:MAG: MltA domain-containing protein [Desulfobulbaceae bacterium]|nr:MltA domain-containing protein [Desulfobulbaceae bacterium]